MTSVFVGGGLIGLGGSLAERHGRTFVFKVFYVGEIVYGVVLLALLRDPPDRAEERRPANHTRTKMGAAPDGPFSRPGFLVASLYWGMRGVAGWAVVGWMSIYLRYRPNTTYSASSLSAIGYLHLATLVGVMIGGYWADRLSRYKERGSISVRTIVRAISRSEAL